MFVHWHVMSVHHLLPMAVWTQGGGGGGIVIIKSVLECAQQCDVYWIWHPSCHQWNPTLM